MPTPRKIFLSYAHEDLDYKNELVKHLSALRRQGLIAVWHDRMIQAGVEWDPAILTELENADLILLLVSPGFINSEYIWEKEITIAMARHEQRSAIVIPVILKPCDWTKMPFSKLQGLPIGVKPISRWPDRDEAFYSVAMGIRQVIERMENG